jgi:hypothetical protein
MKPLEPPSRLSESLIWRLQREFYATQGPAAWTDKQIPTWITSNSFFARAFAGVTAAFVRDLAAADGGPATLNIVELASGSGQFAFQFLRRLAEMRRALPALAGMPVRYVLTDFTDGNVRAWEAHERFRPYLEDGTLDFATFDLERDSELRLLRSGQTLGAATPTGPMVVLANYAFDSTLQDCFRVRAGTLCEDLVQAMVPDGSPLDPAAPGQLERIAALEHQPRPVSGAYYGDERLDRILESYRRRLGDTAFLFPIGALRAARTLLDMSGGRLLLLCGDKGVAREEDLQGRGDPVMVRHRGCFSFSVNLHAVGRYFEEAGGFALHTDQPRPRIQVSAFLGGWPADALAETRQAFRDATSGFSPGDFHTLAVAMCEQKHPQPLDVMLSVLKLAAFDAEVLYSYREALVAAARSATPVQKEELRRALALVWDGFYPLHKDVALELARISFAMSDGEDALRYCRESLRLFGESPPTLVMQGYSLAMLGRAGEAVRGAQRALALQPGFTPAAELLERLGGITDTRA